MKEQIYQCGFYIMLGIFIGILIGINIQNDSVKSKKEITEIIQDSSLTKVLNEYNLKEELIKCNIPHADIVLAQAKLETGHFKSKLVQTHQNIFGLKKGNSYRQYSHWTECVQDYKKYISNRYKGGDYFEFLDKIGYATDTCYTKTLKKMI